MIQYNARAQPSQTPTPKLLDYKKEEHQFQAIDFGIFDPWIKLPINPDEVFVTYTNDRLLKGSGTPSREREDRVLASQCFLALATSYFAHDHHQTQLVEKGYSRYGAALSKLHAALSDEQRRASYDILEAVMLMCLFETLMSDKKDGWVTHSLGIQRLFELRGPESFKTMPARDMFETARPTIIYACLTMRQLTMLSQPDWKTVPWSNDPGGKSLYEHLIDILADTPKLICAKDEALALDDAEARKIAIWQVVRQAQHLLTQLRTWKVVWDDAEPDCSVEVATTQHIPLQAINEENPVLVKAWETVYSFTSVYHAVTIAHYHATLIHLHRLVRGYDESADARELEAAEIETVTSGFEICRTIEYHLRMSSRGEGSFSIMFALRMAWEAVEETEPGVAAWLQDVLQKIATSPQGRWAVASYLLNRDEIPRGPRTPSRAATN